MGVHTRTPLPKVLFIFFVVDSQMRQKQGRKEGDIGGYTDKNPLHSFLVVVTMRNFI